MKKLTAGIFATILGVTAMGAADAAVTSKGYVDAAVGTVAQSVTNLGTTVAGHTTAIADLQEADTTLQANIDGVSAVASAAATKAEVGTPDEGKTVVGMIKEVEANGYSDIEVRGLIKDNADAIDIIEAEQLTQNENITNLQTNKANSADLGTAAYKAATDFADAATTAQALAAKANTADLADVATTGSYNSLTDLPTLGTAAAANIGDFATKAQGDLADTNAADIVNLKAADATFELKANVSGAQKNVANGKYVLTMITDENGAVTGYGWELIDRDYAVDDVTE